MLAYDRSSTGLWVALIFLVSLNLRPTIAAVGPVLAQMGTDLAWGEGVQGVLTAIPLIAFAAVSPLVTFLARRIGILSGLVIPKLMNVRGNQVCAALTASAPMLIAGLGMLLLPHLMPVWAFVGGCAQGASLVVALALIALRGHDSAETVVLSGVAQSFGYLIASLGPLMFGVLVQATGGHHVPLMVFTFVAFLQCVVAVVVGKPSKM